MATTSRPSPDLLGLRAVVRDPAARTVLLMMVGADLVLIALHLSAASRGLEASLHYVDLEYGHAESLQGLRWLWCLGLLGLVVVAARRWAFASLLPLLALLLLTDALELHERGGSCWRCADRSGSGATVPAPPASRRATPSRRADAPRRPTMER